jgi:hypothetical protein
VIEDAAAGAISPEVREHMVSCDPCASLVQRFSRGWESLTAPEPVRPGRDFLAGLIARIEADRGRSAAPKAAGRLLWRILRPVGVAALFLGAVLAGHELGQAGKPPSQPESEFVGPSVEIFEAVPEGSAAHFFINRRNGTKEGRE